MGAMFSNSSAGNNPGKGKSDSRPATILVVEDSKDTRNVLGFSLMKYGYKVVTAINGQEAVEVALRERPNIILMDLNMPLMDGLTATERMREHEELSKVPILAVTAYDTYGMKEAAEAAGCDGYIKKPIDFNRLDTILRRILSC